MGLANGSQEAPSKVGGPVGPNKGDSVPVSKAGCLLCTGSQHWLGGWHDCGYQTDTCHFVLTPSHRAGGGGFCVSVSQMAEI